MNEPELDELNQRRLKEDLIQSIQQFHRYAEMYPIDRNVFVVNLLDKLQKEAQKAQLSECELLSNE